METATESVKPAKQPLVNRIGFFVLGGVASTVINKNLLDVGQNHLHLNHIGAYAFSSGTTAVIFFLWSYFVNFRTSVVWKDCLFRYIAAFFLALLVNNLIAVPILARYGQTGGMKYLIIGAVQSFTGGIKFLLYHFWVFPHTGEPAEKTKPSPEPLIDPEEEEKKVQYRGPWNLPAWGEASVWTFVIAVTVGIRLYLVHLLPMGLWSKDAGSYAYSAFRWMHSGHWETDPRRGPVYSLLIAFCGKVFGSIYSLMVLQHIMGIVAILLSVFALRLLHGRKALLPIAACGFAYGIYGLPLYLEHLVRNETILFFCGSVSLVTWLFAIKWKQPHWLWITGAAAAILTATKNVWLPFPVLFAAATLWYYRKEMRLAWTQVIIFVIAFAVPYLGLKVFKHRTLGVDRSDAPQDGVLLYGRTAQFTDLDGGIEPQIKAQIRDQVVAYQKEVFGDGSKPPHLNNNEILKSTVVPHLTSILRKEGKDAEDLNRLCRALAFEAIKTHPAQYAAQVLRDMAHMHLTSGVRYVAPDNAEPLSQRDLLQELDKPDPMIHADESIAKLDQIIGHPAATDDDKASKKELRKHPTETTFNFYDKILLSAWMFDFVPVLLTTLLLPLIFFLSPLPTRAWWLGAAGLWYFTVVLLATVGRPLDRYLIPALPVMFYTLSSALILAWNALGKRLATRPH